ncbi:MAG: glycerol-3-phosphate 1-O-acyltransferase PlsY [Bacteroidetes bacterium]|nr:glycerol-3-phosphate 1-O-acyltransferase PlsY [Bacteroidota bacterium]
MSSLINITILIVAYLLGSIPTAVWVGKRFYGIDVREHGSGNAGATNTFRVLGKRAGIPVLVIDILKGFLAASLAYFANYQPGTNQFINLQLVLGTAALLGHLFPIFAAFRGGKGIATILGVIISVHPSAALLSIGIFLFVFLTTRYVSLGSMVAAVMFPVVIVLVFKSDTRSLLVFSFIIAILVLVTHQNNIERLLRGKESRISFKKKSMKVNPNPSLNS